MSSAHLPLQHLLTLPPRMAEAFPKLEHRGAPGWFAASDPEERSLGSGGGTANLLAKAWKATGKGLSFSEWLRTSPKLVLHAGGQSRRLPAYAPGGKLLMPMPVFRWARGQKLEQSLLDLQAPDYERVLRHAGSGAAATVASGDVLLQFGATLPPFPQVDVLGLGMWIAPEKASGFGVFCSPRQRPSELAFFLQKPSAEKIRSLAGDYLCLVDTGMWLLSERAVMVLMQRSGWNASQERFARKGPRFYELYSGFGLALGTRPTARDAAINALSCAVLPLPEARFFHFGTSEQLIDSVAELQTSILDETKVGHAGATDQPDLITQNSRVEAALRRGKNRRIWIENSVVHSRWELGSEHVLTGIPENLWRVRLPAGACIDFVPVGKKDFCIRAYGFHDRFAGQMGSTETLWQGAPARSWFQARGLSLRNAGLDPESDIQESPLFPVLGEGDVSGEFLQWLVDRRPADPDGKLREKWLANARLSARQISASVNLARLYGQRSTLRAECLLPMWKNHRHSVFFRLDLESTAKAFAKSSLRLPSAGFADRGDPMNLVHDRMFLSAVLRHRANGGWRKLEMEAFAELRRAIVQEAQLAPAMPRANVQEDQIVWARSPIRMDLAGGWTDTPPYCLENGGRVLNLAADLNGQPPIQVFAKLSQKPEIVLRSIDLGLEQRIRTYEELDTFAEPGSPFGLPKAALALAGFLPRFNAAGGHKNLAAQMEDFGGGLELSLLSAVPKGSGLGTSSILAATVLAALGDLCGLGWDKGVLFSRTLALEQMLTTGGGWQDQAGALFGGIKLIETSPGLAQKPTIRWLPPQLFSRDYANRVVLLYYTGITRLAKNILAEIVRGLFLNSPSHLQLIGEIGQNALYASEAIQRCDYDMLMSAIDHSWRLNKTLDSGTNPAQVQAILKRVAGFISAAKLLGAGGGGYLLMFAKDEEAAVRARAELVAHPPNPRARFVEFSVSEAGLQLTRS